MLFRLLNVIDVLMGKMNNDGNDFLLSRVLS